MVRLARTYKACAEGFCRTPHITECVATVQLAIQENVLQLVTIQLKSQLAVYNANLDLTLGRTTEIVAYNNLGGRVVPF